MAAISAHPNAVTGFAGPGASQPSVLASSPATQRRLLLHGKGQPYQVHVDEEIPQLTFGDLLVEIYAIGLNPIDWKSAAFGFGLPELPCVNGREFVGKIIASHVEDKCDLKPGEWVLAVSTDYRDFRKSAFQEFAIVCCYNAIRIPHSVNPFRVASIGVAYVAAGLALGACLGTSFPRPRNKRPFNLLDVSQRYLEDVPDDIAPQIIQGLQPGSRASPGEWLLVYGASSITAQLVIQLAKLAGLKVAGVANLQKHRALLESLGTDVLIDRTNLDEANKQIRRVLPNSLRFAVDTVGPDTASWCQDVLAAVAASRRSSPNETLGEYTNPIEKSNPDAERKLGHLVTLTGKPKTGCPDVQVHQVPIKLFHAHMMVGGYLSKWLYELLETGLLQLPGVDFVDGGLDSVNAALENLKAGNVSGRRLVVKLKETATDL